MDGWNWLDTDARATERATQPPPPTSSSGRDAAAAAPTLTEPPQAEPAQAEPGYLVPLLGRRVVGPFCDIDEDGGPLVELYEVVAGQDASGRVAWKGALIDLVGRDMSRLDLLNDPELGRRWYRAKVRDARGQIIDRQDIDLRSPNDPRRRRGRARPAPEPTPPPPSAVGALTWQDVEDRVERAVEKTRANCTAAHRELVAAIERERDMWQARAEAAERAMVDAEKAALDYRLQLVEARAGGGGGAFDFEQAREVIGKARMLHDQVTELIPVAETTTVERPSMGGAMLDGLHTVRRGAAEIVAIGQLFGVKIGGGDGDDDPFNLPRVGVSPDEAP